MKKTTLSFLLVYISVFLTFSQEKNTDIFNILFQQSFEDNTVGNYLRSEWAEDWHLPLNYGSDPRPQNWDSYGQLKIVNEGGNKFFRREVKAGEISTGSRKGCNWFVDIPDVDELYFSFRVRFPYSMFNQGKHIGGKLNGLYNPYSKNPVGEKPLPNTGFNTLMMFGNPSHDYSKLKMSLYIYYQEMKYNACKSSYPLFACPEEDRIYYGNYSPVNFYFEPDTWYNITQRLVMNDTMTSNGIIEIYIDGQLIASYNHFRFRDTEDIKIEYLEITNFFGGGISSAPKYDTWFDFDDFIAFTYKNSADMPKGTLKNTDRKPLKLPYVDDSYIVNSD